MTQIEDNSIFHRKTVIQHLLEKYGEDIVSTIEQNTTVCFKQTGHNILTERQESLRLVEAAADVILKEIRSVPYVNVMDDYPPPDTFFDENVSLVPQLLKVFLEAVTLEKKRWNTDK